jgi:hypothetical protein
MIIDVRTNDCLYVTINGWMYYIDDSTNEQIVHKWKVKKNKKHAKRKKKVYMDKHVSCPSYPACEDSPLGCIIRQGVGNVEWYGHKD